MITLSLSKLTQSDFIQKILAALGSRGIVIVLGLLNSVIIARALEPEGRGKYGVACAVTAIGTQIGLLGFQSSNTFHVSKDPSLLSRLISNSILISIGVGGILCGTIYFLRHLILGTHSLSTPILIAALTLIPLYICFTLFQGLLTGIQRFKEYNLSDILNRVLITTMILLLFFFFHLSLLSAILLQGVSLIICLAFMMRTFSESIVSFAFPCLKLIRENFFYSGKAFVVCIFGWLLTRMDLFILQRFHSFETVGYFSIALTLTDFLFTFSAVIATILLPKLCVEQDIEKKWALTKKTMMGSGVVILSAAFIVMISDAPIRILFGHQFAPCHHILILLLPGFILLSLESIFVQFINSITFPWSIVMIWLTSLCMKGALSLTLIPTMGIKGIGISWNATYLFIFIAILINVFLIKKNAIFKTNLIVE